MKSSQAHDNNDDVDMSSKHYKVGEVLPEKKNSLKALNENLSIEHNFNVVDLHAK